MKRKRERERERERDGGVGGSVKGRGAIISSYINIINTEAS